MNIRKNKLIQKGILKKPSRIEKHMKSRKNYKQIQKRILKSNVTFAFFQRQRLSLPKIAILNSETKNAITPKSHSAHCLKIQSNLLFSCFNYFYFWLFLHSWLWCRGTKVCKKEGETIVSTISFFSFLNFGEGVSGGEATHGLPAASAPCGGGQPPSIIAGSLMWCMFPGSCS